MIDEQEPIALTSREVLEVMRENRASLRQRAVPKADRERLEKHSLLATWYLQGIRGTELSDAQQNVVVRFAQQHLQAYSPALLVQLLDDVPFLTIHIYPYLTEYVQSIGDVSAIDGILGNVCSEIVALCPPSDAPPPP